jgi:single-strand DNA-binding protein
MPDFRMPDLNKVYIAGRLTRDPELKYTQSGLAMCRLGLAASHFYKGRDGEKKEETLFIDVTVWDKQAEYLGQRLRQGSPVLVEGRLRTDSWEDKTTGQKRSKIDVQALRVQELSWPGEKTGGAVTPEPQANQEEPIPEDDIPF